MASSVSSVRDLVRRLDELGRVSDEPDRLTRTFLSPAMRRANALVGGWMWEAGLAVREDGVGNLIGRLEAPRRSARTLLLGSHLDTVRDAGRFDGALGVLLSIAAVAELGRHGVVLPYAVEVLGFAEEEGVRFAGAYLGSKGYCGTLRAADLALADAEGVTVRQALEAFHGGPLPRLRPAHRPADLLGYLEVHIEQGPVLESRGLALGVVSAIAGQSRVRLTWRGRAGHAGTTPMRLRHDALAGAAELVLAAESLARRRKSLVATVGDLTVAPGAANVIPGEAVHTLDVRHPEDEIRTAALAELRAKASRIAERRGLGLDWKVVQDNGAVACSSALSTLLTAAVRSHQGRSLSLPSGAGHDAVVVSTLAPVAMLFVRCREGLSHHPDEYAAPDDLAAALAVAVDFLLRLAKQVAP
jgi:allantoate deiminase